MNTLLSYLKSIKLSLTAYAISSLTFIVGVLLLIIGYKNRQLHGAQVSLLRAEYGSRLASMNDASFKAAKAARGAYDKYLETKQLYEQKHGKIE